MIVYLSLVFSLHNIIFRLCLRCVTDRAFVMFSGDGGKASVNANFSVVVCRGYELDPFTQS